MDRQELLKNNGDIGLTGPLLEAMEAAGIDIPLSSERIRRANNGDFERTAQSHANRLPQADDPRVIDLDNHLLTIPLEEARSRLEAIPLPFSLNPEEYGTLDHASGLLTFQPDGLQKLGFLLAPAVAFGSLNGGSASSYLDRTRIRKSFEPLLNIYGDILSECDRICAGKPKGSTPAYWNPDGTPGFGFLEMKVRALLIRALHWRELTGIEDHPPLYPMFEMTSHLTHDYLRKSYQQYADKPLLRELARATGWEGDSILSAQQPLLAAMTHDPPYRFFDRAWGKPDTPLPMPGGHGHNFLVLRDTYRLLYERGVRFVYLGNIDNSGLLVDDRAVATLALSGKQGCFDFSFKTDADIKGGILIEDERGRLNCGDIGLAISSDEADRYQAAKNPILFNAASGLFNLEWLLDNLDRIIRDLPTRIIHQEKDRGRYSQTEQVTWEILGMMDNKFICMVNKYDRFIAAKTVMEMLIASQLGEERLQHPTFPKRLRTVATNLQEGLARLLAGPYGMRLATGRWEPLPLTSLRTRLNPP